MSKQEFNGVHLIPVSRKSSSQIHSTLTQLSLGGQMMHVGDLAFVLFRSNEDNTEELKQVQEVINRLSTQEGQEDVEQNPQPKGDSSKQGAGPGTPSSGQQNPTEPGSGTPGSGNPSGASGQPSGDQAAVRVVKAVTK